MIDKKWIGHELPAATMTVERGRVRFFAQAIGETNPVHSDVEAARAAGYPDLLAPPTFLFSVDLEAGNNSGLLQKLNIPLEKLLHGEQGFTYHRPVCAGDTITVQSRVDDIYAKKDGALEFVVKTSRATNQKGELVAELRSTIVCRNTP